MTSQRTYHYDSNEVYGISIRQLTIFSVKSYPIIVVSCVFIYQLFITKLVFFSDI